MHLLVDGHNLIGQMPGLSLADADDEARLVLLLRGYANRKRGRQVVIVFDRGVYGHPQRLDGYGVTCHFAKSPQDADTQLIRRLRALRRPREWALVSSDRQVARVAEECGVRVLPAHEFAAQLFASTTSTAPAQPPPEKPDVRLSPAEVEEWLRMFGEPAGEEPRGETQDDDRPDEATGPAKRKRRRGR
jgi:predicted RNA-binding protein with PIN domain